MRSCESSKFTECRCDADYDEPELSAVAFTDDYGQKTKLKLCPDCYVAFTDAFPESFELIV